MKSRFKITNSAKNEIYKTISVYFRTLSLALMIFAIVDPMQNPESYILTNIIISVSAAIIAFFISLAILLLIKEDKA